MRTTSEYVCELYHHGIKGQRWGVRRFQNKNGSLTPEGKKRYYDTPELNKQKSALGTARSNYKTSKSAYNKAISRYQNWPSDANERELEKTRTEFVTDRTAYRRAKLKYDTNKEVARIQDKGVEIKKKSKHRLKLEDQYKKMGMIEEQAQAAANNQIRTEKILAASAVVTIAACATYIAVKSRKNRIDGVIKAGESLQRIEMQDTGGKLHKVFYAASGEKDMRRYENMLGKARKNATGHAYMMKLQAQSDVKVASIAKCRKTFQELYDNDPEFKKSVRAWVPDIGVMNKRQKYDYFNKALVYMHDDSASKKFYDKLKSAGYGAIQDINDMKFSGYHAKNPLIIFDNSKGNILVKSVSELTGDLNRKGMLEAWKAVGETLTEDFLKKAGPTSAAALTGATVLTYRTDPNRRYNPQGGTSKWS